jgi:hypothetical protein
VRKQGSRRRAVATLFAAPLAACAIALPIGGASAHTAVLQNGLVFEPTATGPTTIDYKGQVFGPSFCHANRAVDIFVGGVFFKTAFTNASGKFSVTGPLPPPGTEATAVARKKVKKTKNHNHTCPSKTETKKAA